MSDYFLVDPQGKINQLHLFSASLVLFWLFFIITCSVVF